MPLKKSKKVKKAFDDKKIFSRLSLIGGILIIIALFIPLSIFSPVLKSEISYQFSSRNLNKEIIPVDTNFSIVIPKINANTKVIDNVDPFNSHEYQIALTRGVAHAKGSSTPNSGGNTFIFAHSAGNWYQANQYNAVFYLLNKLIKDDEIIIYYQSQPYHYSVIETKLVNASEINYLIGNSPNQLTLMTCWPPGTTLKRLLVIATLKND
ncbi:MAG: sortase [Candidatus Shapirobacteria bacterium]|nr:sortase [Candidatus Shapirobacteria bacterium]